MLIEMTEGVFWDDEQPLYKQSDDARASITSAMMTTAIKREYETCLAGKRRTTLWKYKLTDTFGVKRRSAIYHTAYRS